jgi:hypothetical protein
LDTTALLAEKKNTIKIKPVAGYKPQTGGLQIFDNC